MSASCREDIVCIYCDKSLFVGRAWVGGASETWASSTGGCFGASVLKVFLCEEPANPKFRPRPSDDGTARGSKGARGAEGAPTF